MEIKTKNQDETIALGRKIGSLLSAGMCITLEGDLGAGKTTFTKGIAEGMGVKKTVNSPTFTIMKIYQGNLPLYHIDAYRLEGAKQDLGFEEYIDGDGVCVIEWAQFIEYILPSSRLVIRIARVSEEERIFEIQAHGSAYEMLLGELSK